jgi:hypothetical protein
MLSNKRTKANALPVLILLLMIFAGCASKGVQLFLIEPTDIYVQENGDICMSEFYFNKVLHADMERK